MSHKWLRVIAALTGACGLLLAVAAQATPIISEDGGSSRDDRSFVEPVWQPLATRFDSLLADRELRGNELVFLERTQVRNFEAVALRDWLTDTFVLDGLDHYLKNRELTSLLREDRLIYGDGSADRLARLLGSGKNHKCKPGYGEDFPFAQGKDCECDGNSRDCRQKKKEVPEPGTFALGAAALLGSGYLLVRRRRLTVSPVT